MDETVIIDRDYIDSFSIKDYCVNTLIPKYFPDIDVSLRTVGLVGYVTELITNYGEDTFNTGSVLFRETFPNRAQVEESIYSHAAIFQLDYILSKPAVCKFLLILDENAIIQNMVNNYDKDTGIYHFYIDKNTRINVENLAFTLDYDIQMDIVKKTSVSGDEYLFSARYMTEEYTDVLSDIVDPYIKIRRSNDGYIALEIITHQCIREVRDENIIDNNTINFPAIDVDYEGNLAGFDVLYRAPGEEEYTQMTKQIVYSTPIRTPFCYYQFIKENQFRLTFNSKDNYFMPEFNSDIRIILYYTEGENGNFEEYNGTNISIIPNTEKYSYSNLYLIAAKPIGSSEEGTSQSSIDALQALTVESYRTAKALTTENDLQEYFNNYKYRYGNSDILFIKKRDDVYERVYSAFMIARDGNYIYKTNTLNLKLNIADMRQIERNTYVLEPGYLFTANDDTGYVHFFTDEEKYNKYHEAYEEAIKNNEIPYIEDTSSTIPAYLDRAASYAEFKKRNGFEDKVTIFDVEDTFVNKYDSPIDLKFLYINPFLIRFIKQPNLVTVYMTYINNDSILDFIDENDDSFVQFITYDLKVKREFTKDKVYNIKLSIAPSITLSKENYVVKRTSDNKNYILNDKYAVVNNDLRVIVLFKNKDENVAFAELYPTEYDEEGGQFTYETNIFTDDHITSDGRFRILDGKIYRNPIDGSYYKMHTDDATLYDEYNANNEIILTDVPVDDVTALSNAGIYKVWYNVHNMTASDQILIPIENVTCEIYTLYNKMYDTNKGNLAYINDLQTNNIFYKFDPSLNKYFWTNKYSTATDTVTFIKSLDSVRTYLSFEDYTSTHKDDNGNIVFDHDLMDVEMKSISFLRAKTYFDTEKLNHFMSTFKNNYNFLNNIIDERLRNCTNLDMKMFNTYGRSKNLIIGEDESNRLDTLNLQIELDVWFISGTDLLAAVPEVKEYIKKQIETINTNVSNYLHISNLLRKIENNFGYVDHIRFVRINRYNSTFQTVKAEFEDIDDLSVEQRRFYVPELLVCDLDDIIINEYFVQ